MRAIGLMSGTSVDAVDAVLTRIESPAAAAARIVVESHITAPLPNALRERIHSLITEPRVTLAQLGEIDTELGQRYADAANQIINNSSAPIDVIGCHGQTIRHHPAGRAPHTLQLGNAALVAQHTGAIVVGDFRSADVAVGGQGAPLAPAFHRAMFYHENQNRAIVNLGGIANITYLPRDGAVVGFDTGPANTLMDDWCRLHFGMPFDRDGVLAAGGKVQAELLQLLLADEYFARRPPKSTGREYFNRAWLAAKLAKADAPLAPRDVLATLAALTADSIAAQLTALTPDADAVYFCGGGVRNATLMQKLNLMIGRMLGARRACHTATTDELGVAPQCVEAAAFAYLAHQTLARTASTLPAVTGATKATIAGAIYYP